MSNKGKISVVVPAYNEEKDLHSSIRIIYNYLTKLVEDEFEILIIENGSSDRTAEIAKNLEIEYDNVKSFSLNTPSYGAAYRYGILLAKNNMVTLYPVDLAFSLDFIGRAFRLINKYPTILGVRNHKKSEIDRPFIRILISKIHTILVNILLGTNYNDVDCLKAFQTPIAKKIVNHTSANGPFIEVEIVYLLEKLGVEYLEIPIDHIEKEIARHPTYIIRSIMKNFVKLILFKIRMIIS
jgi:glycosyltransferase involved in cell wall biosynthesis